MNITLNIENDEQFRQHIKDAIDGQIRGIVRSEVNRVVVDEVARVLPAIVNGWRFNEKADVFIEKAVGKIINNHASEIGFTNSFITDLVNKKVGIALEHHDWNVIVDTLAKEKIKAMLTNG